jgi:hypothetical protein
MGRGARGGGGSQGAGAGRLRAGGLGLGLVDEVDCMFFFGDLNYRLDLQREEVEHPVTQMRRGAVDRDRALQRLLDFDQLTQQRARGRVFRGLTEGPVTFMPTFKVGGSVGSSECVG